jgi:hypothetical protein
MSANLQDNGAIFRIFISVLRFSFDSPSYIWPTKRVFLWSSVHFPNTELAYYSFPFTQVKVQLKLSLCLKHIVMKMYVGLAAQLQAFLLSALDWNEWPAARPGSFTQVPTG